MADKDFGVKRISLIGASGTPTITSPNNLNINANTVAISTNISIGGQVNSDLKIGNSFFVGIGSTVPTVKLDVIGDGKFTGSITASSILGTALSVSGVSTFTNGPVFIGGGTSTGTLGQVLQVSGINSSVYIGGNLGIGSTNPQQKLWVEGNGYFSGIVTSFKLNSTVGVITNLTGTNLNYTGISTLGITSVTDLTAQQLNVSGVSTFTNGPVFIGGGTSTGTLGQVLQVSGINSSVYIGGNLGIGSTNPQQKLWVEGNGYFSGIVTSFKLNSTVGVITNLTGTNLNYTGISTLGITSVTDLTAQQLNVSGVSTFTNGPVFIGGGTSTGTLGQVLQVSGINSSVYIGGNLGIGSTNPQQKLWVEGNGYFSGIVTSFKLNSTVGVITNLTGTNLNYTGISTLGITSVTDLTAQQLNVSGVSTVGVLTATNIGIGTTNPSSALWVGGDIFVSGISTLGITSVTDLTAQQLNVSGVSTFTNGPVFIGGGTSTGTLGQVLQVSGINSSVYIGGNLGIGSTNPQQKLWVEGNGYFSGIVTSTGFYVDGALIGSGNISGGDIVGTALSISGISTLSTVKISSGIITSTNPGVTTVFYYGDGSNLTGIGSAAQSQSVSVSNDQTDETTNIIFVSDPTISVASTLKTNSNLVFNAGNTRLGIGTTNALTTLHVGGKTYIDGNLGIGSTNPTSKLWVEGDGNFTGVITASKFNVSGLGGGGQITAGDIVGTALSISGISTLSTVKISSGIITSTNPGVTTVFYYGDFYGKINGQVAVQGNSIGAALTTLDVIGGIASVSQLSVSGFSTVGVLTATNIGIGTTNPSSALWVGGDIFVSGISTLGITSATDLTSKQLNVSGIATVGVGSTGVKIDGIAGIITSSNPGITTVVYYGDGSKLTGNIPSSISNINVSTNYYPLLSQNISGTISSISVSSSSIVFNPGLSYLGIGTTNPTTNLDVLGSIKASNNLNVTGIATVGVGSTGILIDGITGIITSSNPGVTTVVYYGDGSKLTGIGTASAATSVVLTADSVSTNTSIVFSKSASANPTADLNSNPNLIFNAATSSLGIGTTTPTSKLWVNGDGYFVGVVTSKGFYVGGNLIGSGSISGGSIVGTALSVSGISTLGNVQIEDGKITAASGIVTYYGDGSKLTNLTANIGDLYELDDISYATNDNKNTFTPTYNYNTVSVENPFKLLITINGVLQSAYIHNVEYVWNNNLLCTNDGYTIDYDGNIKFTEPLPVGTQVVIKTAVGSDVPLPRKYPFKPLDVMF